MDEGKPHVDSVHAFNLEKSIEECIEEDLRRAVSKSMYVEIGGKQYITLNESRELIIHYYEEGTKHAK